jgi:hypothetical protein
MAVWKLPMYSAMASLNSGSSMGTRCLQSSVRSSKRSCGAELQRWVDTFKNVIPVVIGERSSTHAAIDTVPNARQ